MICRAEQVTSSSSEKQSSDVEEKTRPTTSVRARRFFANVRGAIVFSLGLAAVDFVLRLGAVGYQNPRRWEAKEVGLYALGLLWSLFTWMLFSRLLLRLRGRPRLALGLRIATAFVAALLFSLSFAYLKNFDQSPSWQVLKFAVAEPKWLIRLGSWGLKARDLLAFAITAAAAFWLLAPAKSAILRRPRPILRWVRNLSYVALGVVVLGVPGFQSPLPVDTNAAAAVVQFAIAQSQSRRHLVAPVRPPIPKRDPNGRPNVLVFVHESLRADAVFPGLDYANTKLDPKKISPYQSSLPERQEEGFFFFPYARTNSTATESSVPSIVSGIDPGGPADAYGRAQSLWSVGKVFGARTFLFAAEAYSWSHFDEFFIDKNVDQVLTGTELSEAVPIGSTAADDGAVVDAAIGHLKSLAQTPGPFVGAIHFDATHLPGWAGPGTPPFTGAPGDPERYAMSIRYVDGLVERVMKALHETGLDRNTIVLATSDHGENIIPRRTPDRLGAYYEPTVRIPFWIRVPPELLKKHPAWQKELEAWHDKNVQNLDFLPTIRDFLSLGDEPELLPPHIPGQSLLRPPPVDNQIAGQSTCAIRAWALEGFYAVRGRTKVIVSNDRTTAQIYDLDADPFEKKNLWKDDARRKRVMPWLEPLVRAGEGRSAVCRRLEQICPVSVTDR